MRDNPLQRGRVYENEQSERPVPIELELRGLSWARFNFHGKAVAGNPALSTDILAEGPEWALLAPKIIQPLAPR